MELIEREQQLKKLADVWSQVRAGKGSIALISGEAGIGKTSLIERFVSEQGRSARLLWGACDDMFSPQPLGPFLDIALRIQSNLLQLIQAGADHLTISVRMVKAHTANIYNKLGVKNRVQALSRVQELGLLER